MAKSNLGHWTTTRYIPSGYNVIRKYKIFKENQPETRLLYECNVIQNHNFVSKYMNCENQNHLGPLGYVYTNQQANTIPLVRCFVSTSGDHFITTTSNCDGFIFEEILGYALLA